jgi:hypothetical protein
MLGSKAVEMERLALDQPGNRLQTHMGMWTDARTLRLCDRDRTQVVDETPRANASSAASGQ